MQKMQDYVCGDIHPESGQERRIKTVKRRNKHFRRELMNAQESRTAVMPVYSLDYDKDDSVTIYSSDSVLISCSSNLLEPEVFEMMRTAF